MSHKAKVEEWLADARERLTKVRPGSRWHRDTEKIIQEYERLLEQLNETKQREPGEESLFP
jgi:hypothetical protein